MLDDQRFIPFSRSDVVRMCSDRLPDGDGDGFRALAEILAAMVHVEYQSRLDRMKEAYTPFATDSDLRRLRSEDGPGREEAGKVLLEELTALLDDANYEPVGDAELAHAFEEESLLPLRLHVDFDDFEEVLFYRRGVTRRREEVPELFGLRRREIEFTTYSRVVVFVRFRGTEHFAAEEVEQLPFTPGATLVKLFQDVPRADLEMLFPNTEVGMRPKDKLLLGVPAAVSGLILLFTKLISSLGLLVLLIGFYLGLRDEAVTIDQAALVALGAGAASLGGFLVKQWSSFKNRKIQFMKQLSENLYFRNLDNDVGVFFHLIDAAEEEEIKETLLAYSALRHGGPMTADALDADIESWLAAEYDCRLDFEISDALGDATRLGIVEADDAGGYRAVELAAACERLDQRWDSVFTYHSP